MRRYEMHLFGGATAAGTGGPATGNPPSRHDTLREGAMLGLAVATGTWLWLALFDAAVGEPFQTFMVLGGIVVFTLIHYLLNIAYGVAVVAGVHGTVGEPSLIIAVMFGFVMLEVAFAMITALLSHIGLGGLAWIRIFGGSLAGAVIAIVLLKRRHPILEELRDAK